MKRFYLSLSVFFLITATLSVLQAQRLEQFSEARAEFISQLEQYMTASKQQSVENTYKEFEGIFKSGMFSDEEIDQILYTGNAMLARRMSANPYFHTYLAGLIRLKSTENSDKHFKEWHTVLDTMLADKDNTRSMNFQDFLTFSISFFEHRALRYSPTGTSWFALGEDYSWGYEQGEPYLSFEELDLLASRKQDSIFIYQTSGRFLPIEETWKGEGGNVTWERFGWSKDSTYVELPEYEFEMNRSLYLVKNARLHYPLFFGTKVVEGDFSDKLTVENAVTGSSYPRFESYDDRLELDNIGSGIKYTGGFRLHGTTIYGFGTKDRSAKLNIFDKEERLTFRAVADLYTIRREEEIIGEGVEAAFYFRQDSIFHPSVNIRFSIQEKEMILSRGDRGSDRNPFFSSIHEINIDADKIYAYLDRDSVVIGKETIDIARKKDIFFESHDYFNENDYRRIQNIAPFNPIAIMKVTAEREGNNFIDANLLAQRINSKFTVDNIQSLLYDLSAKGFINYNSEEEIVEVKDKVFHYADADQGKVDYDDLRIRSVTDSANAVLNLQNNEITINGIEHIEFSRRQKVALLPENGQITLLPDRDMNFGGKMYAGFTTLQGNGFHLDYTRFQIELDSVGYFDLFVPTGEFDSDRNPIAQGINSRIENLSGVLLIDAPNNKSGKEEIVMFPSLQSKKKSYVFYDYEETRDSIYTRDSFYFEVDPFSFNHLDAFTARDIRFEGRLASGGIFPDINEALTLQEDRSLGFTTQTPEEGYPNYRDKGNFSGEIQLSNKGLTGKGTQQYLMASINSEDIVFLPQRTLASAEEFNLEEVRSDEREVPQVRGQDVSIDWRPYKDSMYIRPKEVPFALFKENNHTLDGTMILTPGGLKGDGLLAWDKANMQSKYFSFGAFSTVADTTDVSIRAFNTEELALQTENVFGSVDFDEQVGTFKANEEFLETTLPYNQYQTSMNEFDWDMKEETITFNAEAGSLGSFISIHPDQDSLRFQGESAFYDLKTNQLNIGGVPFLVSADAFVYPDSGKVDIQPGGVMNTLNNARIVADTINQLHVINRATVDVRGRKEYRASGFYEYNIGDKEQEIEFADIAGTRVGKGAMSEKRVATRAKGEVTEEDNFYIDHKTEFQGLISLQSESRNLFFDGFARLDANQLPERYWFTIRSEGDKQDLAIKYDSPKDYEGYPLETGLFLSRETAQLYPRVMMPLYFRKDRPIMPVTGVFTYDQIKDEFVFGDSTRILGGAIRGNKLVFSNTDGTIKAEGKFNLGSGLKYVSIDATGRATTAFPPQEEQSNVVSDADSSLLAPPPPSMMPVDVELMAGVKLIVPEKLMKIIITDIQSASFDARNITYLTNVDFYKKAAADLFTNNGKVNEALEAITSGFLDIPAEFNPYTFLFTPLKMKWDPDYQSFITKEPTKVGVNSINGASINKVLTCHIEFKMPTNEDDRLYIYLNSPSGLYYFFGFKQGILNITSNNPKFMDELLNLKTKDLVMKMDDGETYEIQAVEPSTAKLFLRRMEAVGR